MSEPAMTPEELAIRIAEVADSKLASDVVALEVASVSVASVSVDVAGAGASVAPSTAIVGRRHALPF